MKKLMSVLWLLGIILVVVGGGFWLALMFGAEYTPELPLGFLILGVIMIYIAWFLHWRENRMWR